MASARFRSLWVPFQAVGNTMLVLVVLIILIRLWMVNAPKWRRKKDRRPYNITYGLPEPPTRGYTSVMYSRERAAAGYKQPPPVVYEPPAKQKYGYSNDGYDGYKPPMYQEEQKSQYPQYQ